MKRLQKEPNIWVLTSRCTLNTHLPFPFGVLLHIHDVTRPFLFVTTTRRSSVSVKDTLRNRLKSRKSRSLKLPKCTSKVGRELAPPPPRISTFMQLVSPKPPQKFKSCVEMNSVCKLAYCFGSSKGCKGKNVWFKLHKTRCSLG